MTDINDKKNYKPLYALIELTQSIECNSTVLGCREPISVGGVRGNLLLPRLPDWTIDSQDPLHKSLLPPIPAATWKYGKWGQPNSYPSGESSVDRLLLEFVLPETELKASANAIYLALPSWHALFIDYFELVTKQQLYSGRVIGPTHEHLNLFAWTEEAGKQKVHDSVEQEIVIYTFEQNTALNLQMLKDVCMYSSVDRQPALAYRILLQAYRAFSAGDYRKAVIEAGIAAEIALEQKIKLTLQAAKVSYADQLLKKYRMLSGRFELAKMVGVGLPDLDFKILLIEPRNEIVHKADFANEKIALRAIRSVDELLLSISPYIGEIDK